MIRVVARNSASGANINEYTVPVFPQIEVLERGGTRLMPIKASAPLAFLCEKIVPIISSYESLTLILDPDT